MKRTIQFASLASLAVILGGCAGYNTTMFMTKSNAGLDIDMKPPTAEINISRKEAVIEPAFTKGQTPPVMASFKPNVHFGGALGDYFLGVDQTFAGGDAALTMAMLYNSPTPTSVTNGQFDSTLTFTNCNVNTNHTRLYDLIFTPAKPDEVRPFFFGTDTQLGLKVAWSGAGGQFPDTVKAGFNRKEFAWAPVTMSQDGTSIKMPSFLATIQTSTGGNSSTNQYSVTNGTNQTNVSGQNGGISSIQYFATGEAASYLARQKDVRDAMLKRLDPTYGENSKLTFGGQNTEIERQVLFSMNSLFLQLPDDSTASNYVSYFSDLPNLSLGGYGQVIKYQFVASVNTNNGTTFTLNKGCKTPYQPKNNVNDVNFTMKSLEDNIKSLKAVNAVLYTNLTSVQVIDVTSSTTNVLSSVAGTERPIIDSQLNLQTNMLSSIEGYISTNTTVIEAYHYYLTLVQPKQ